MSTTASAAFGRIDRSTTSLTVAVGDIILIGLFVLAGELRHYPLDFLVANPGRILGTALPFYIGWAIVAVVLGAYSQTARESPSRAAVIAGGAWILAAVIGHGLRGTSFFHGDFAVAFFLVSIGVGLVLLIPWRVVVSFTTK